MPLLRTVLLYCLPLALLAVAIVLGLRHGEHPDPGGGPARPLALPPVEAPDAGSGSCATLLAALPAALPANPAPLPRLAIAEPAPPATLAWGSGPSGPSGPVVLRCGLPRPAELTAGAAVVEVDQVRWLTLSEPDRDTFISADRRVFVALTVPRGLGSGPIQAVSDALRAVPG